MPINSKVRYVLPQGIWNVARGDFLEESLLFRIRTDRRQRRVKDVLGSPNLPVHVRLGTLHTTVLVEFSTAVEDRSRRMSKV